jgi:predicted CXXCH cytochrome family protein
MIILAALTGCLLLAGCLDEVSRHRALSTVLDGVPAYPPPGQLCDEYYQQRREYELKGQTALLAGVDGQPAGDGSSHLPYDEKNCNGCHSGDKNVGGGLIVPQQELCFVCHKNFITGDNVHGPVAVGDCLACHLPHTSPEKALLKAAPDILCSDCHQEERLAKGMHDLLATKGMICMDCHDPHFEDARYFLK